MSGSEDGARFVPGARATVRKEIADGRNVRAYHDALDELFWDHKQAVARHADKLEGILEASQKTLEKKIVAALIEELVDDLSLDVWAHEKGITAIVYMKSTQTILLKVKSLSPHVVTSDEQRKKIAAKVASVAARSITVDPKFN